jgi:ribosomal RNA-processing protein 8
MRESPELFDAYHQGFRRQTHNWPRHPLDVCVAWLHRCPSWWSVADIGCGDARLAASVPQKVLSFDLVARQPHVVACDMAHLPLGDASVQAAVFCLALMSTDYGAALEEAARVLAPAGVLWVAEVRSRFEGDGGGVDAFLAAVTALGFQLRQRDESDTMFAVFRWVKTQDAQPPKKGRAAAKWPVLKACEYKRR